LVLSIVGVSIFIFLYEMLFHGMLLSDTYKATATEEAMQDFMGWLILGKIMIAAMFCYLYSFVRMCGGIQGGACFGLTVSLLMGWPSTHYLRCTTHTSKFNCHLDSRRHC